MPYERRDFRPCVQLSPSFPFRRLHTFHFLRPARLRTPLLGYGAPHLSARGTSTLMNNALLSAHFRVADHPECSIHCPACFAPRTELRRARSQLVGPLKPRPPETSLERSSTQNGPRWGSELVLFLVP